MDVASVTDRSRHGPNSDLTPSPGAMALPVPEDNAVFAEREYWDSRFAVEEQYDWLNTYDAYAHILREKVRRGPQPPLPGPA